MLRPPILTLDGRLFFLKGIFVGRCIQRNLGSRKMQTTSSKWEGSSFFMCWWPVVMGSGTWAIRGVHLRDSIFWICMFCQHFATKLEYFSFHSQNTVSMGSAFWILKLKYFPVVWQYMLPQHMFHLSKNKNICMPGVVYSTLMPIPSCLYSLSDTFLQQRHQNGCILHWYLVWHSNLLSMPSLQPSDLTFLK